MRRVFWWAAVAACGTVAPAAAGAQGLIVSGYATAEFEWRQRDSTAADPRTSRNLFDAQNFNVIMLGQLRGDVFVAAEVEYEHGGDEIALEYGYLAFTRWPFANIVALERVVESTKRRRRILTLVQDALSQLRLDMKYLMFDLESTRRERDDYQSKLEQQES